jgi:tetratricopeptide (TPR) repeat protein
MADSLSSGRRPTDATEGAEHDARIEHLLVTGLDHYFAGEFETAINLWTRVLFLDRTHDRARAYIDRARSAQAEQQRASEALVQEGLDAFTRGDVARARALLDDALARGASHDLALGVLGRIDRLDVGHTVSVPVRSTTIRRRAGSGAGPAVDSDVRGRRTTSWIAVASVAFLIVGVAWWASVDGVPLIEWWSARTPVNPAVIVEPIEPLPVPAPAETHVALARSLFASGHVHEALRSLERVPVGDPLRGDADRLRADIQRELLSVATAATIDRPTVSPPPPRRE